jgi:hypothetical protein
MSYSTTPSTPTADEQTVPIDVEHAGIRLAVPVLTVGGFVIGYFVSSWLLRGLDQEAPVGCIAVVSGIVLGVLAAVLADRFLKPLWPSGRTLRLTSDGLYLRDRRKNRDTETRITWDQRVNLVAWRFTVERRSARVQKGWVMLGMKLLQDEAQIVLYTFMPDKDANALPTYHVFTPLVSRAALSKGELSLREASEQRRLLKAEDERWHDGAEVRREDFAAVLDAIKRHVRDPQANAPSEG